LAESSHPGVFTIRDNSVAIGDVPIDADHPTVAS